MTIVSVSHVRELRTEQLHPHGDDMKVPLEGLLVGLERTRADVTVRVHFFRGLRWHMFASVEDVRMVADHVFSHPSSNRRL